MLSIAVKFKGKYAVGIVEQKPATRTMQMHLDESDIEEDWYISPKPVRTYHIKGRIVSWKKAKPIRLESDFDG